MKRNKVESYTIRLLKNNHTKRYFGEVILNGIKEISTAEMMSEINAIKALNKRIEALNKTKAVNLPNYPEIRGHQPIMYNYTFEQIEEDPEQVKPKPSKPKRKPFIPYGLNGYFVDSNGNIRLHLDRRASAETITLETDFFNVLAEMVKRTQEANNAKHA
ncbi:hypothetical protein HPFOLIGI_02126 [Mannheimia haemolytica]